MAFLNIITATTTVLSPNRVNSLLLQINNGWTGTIVITSGSRTVATITNPATSQMFRYWDLTGGCTIVTTGASFGDLTANWQSSGQPR